MATGIAFAEANLTRTTDDGDTKSWAGVQASVRNNTLTIRNQAGDVLDTLPGVTAAVKQSRHRWVIRFGPAEPAVELERLNCNCGAS